MAERVYQAPGPGTWELDATHFSKPTTLFTSSVTADSLVRGFKEGTERYGLLLSYLKPVFIHGFCYMKAMPAFVPEDAPPGPPPEGFFERPELTARFENGPRAIENRLWRDDMKRWDDEIKPDSIRRNQDLQSVQPDSLDMDGLIDHLTECHENLGEMFYRHHIFTIPSLFPIGLYLEKVCRWSGISTGEALGLLKGSTPASLGLATEEIREIAALLKQEAVDPEQCAAESAADTLEALRNIPGPTAAAGRKISRYRWLPVNLRLRHYRTLRAGNAGDTGRQHLGCAGQNRCAPRRG
jgi:pyruvate,water dikinase